MSAAEAGEEGGAWRPWETDEFRLIDGLDDDDEDGEDGADDDDQDGGAADGALADGYQATDVGNADRLIALADGTIRYVHSWS